jgi:predicted sulfurtransferase
MAKGKKCIICEKTNDKLVATQSNPDKYVCFSCLNELIFNTGTAKGEIDIGSYRDAIKKAFNTFKDELEYKKVKQPEKPKFV